MSAAPMDVLATPPAPAPGSTPGADGAAVDPLVFALLVDQAIAAGQGEVVDPEATDSTEDGAAEEETSAEETTPRDAPSRAESPFLPIRRPRPREPPATTACGCSTSPT